MKDPPADLEARLAALDGDESAARVDALNALAYDLDLEENERRIALAREARALAERLGYDAGGALAMGLEGAGLYFRSEHLAALPLLLEALAFAEAHPGEINPEYVGRLNGTLASVHVSLGNYEEALSLALRLLEKARARGDHQSEAWLLQGISISASELGDARQALDFGMQALDCFTHVGVPEGQSRAHSAIGTALRLLGRFDEARGHHEISLQLAREGGGTLNEARALHDLGVLAFAEEHYEEALGLHQRALDLRRRLGNRQAQSTSLIEIGKSLLAMRRCSEAIRVLCEALEIAEALQIKPRIYQAHQALADAYEATGQPAEALRHLRSYQAVREEVLGMEAAARVQTLQARFETEAARRDAEIARLRTVELGQKNEELERLLAELQRTQARLVQSEKLASLGRLTAGIAHEIKNPLNFVNNFAALSQELAGELRETLGAATLPPDLSEELADAFEMLALNLGKIAEHGRRADGIVRSMLGHARASRHERRPTDLHALLARCAELARFSRRATGAVAPAVETAFDPDVGMVNVVPEEVERVFINLIENALHAVEARAHAEGDGYAPLVTLRTKQYGNVVEVRVEDNGPGMTEEVRQRIFEPFFTTKPAGEGTGLGLSLAWDIVVQGHGGTLAAKSTPGVGSTFIVCLPSTT